eukprot:6214588-Pleurochrysis_carterae.AAC.3
MLTATVERVRFIAFPHGLNTYLLALAENEGAMVCCMFMTARTYAICTVQACYLHFFEHSRLCPHLLPLDGSKRHAMPIGHTAPPFPKSALLAQCGRPLEQC